MPTVFRTNNKILPANSRAADVAERAVQEIIPVEQRRYYSAFRVQGIECIAYNRLQQGRKCSCQAHGKAVQGLLNKEGKASDAVINQIITGRQEFSVVPYDEGTGEVPSPWATNKYEGVWDKVKSQDPTEAFERVVNSKDTGIFGDDGPLQDLNLDDLLGDIDIHSFGGSNVSCPVCFGTGFVGGYSAFHSYRHVLMASDVVPVDGQLDLTARPLLVSQCSGWSSRLVLPRGALAVESFKTWNMAQPVPQRLTVDGAPITNDRQLLAFCDGQPHLVASTFTQTTSFTHVEIQFAMSTESLYFEFPKRPSSADTSLLERMEPFQIVMSPNIQRLEDQDVIVESQLGKVMIVQNVNPWQSRQLNVLGPECQVRVIQPQEMFRLLPAKARVPQMQPSTKMVRDNVNGVFRT